MGFGAALGAAMTSWEKAEQERLLEEEKRVLTTDKYEAPPIEYSEVPSIGSSITYPEGYGGLDMLRLNEGLRGEIYKDSEGHETIGYGHKLTDLDKVSGIYNGGISEETAQKLMEEDYNSHKAEVRRVVPNIDRYPNHVQDVVYDMGYNLGPTGLSEFKNMLGAIDIGDYVTGAKELMNSTYARQTGDRAKRNANRLLQGSY